MIYSIRTLLSIGSCLLAVLLFSGCAAAVMTGAKTVKGSESNNVIIAPKLENITAVNKITVDTSGLVGDDADKKSEIASEIEALFVQEMKKTELYQPENSKANSVQITIRTIKREVQQRGVYAIVDVMNPADEIIFSFASVETSLGLRTITYIERKFTESAVELIAAPLPTD